MTTPQNTRTCSCGWTGPVGSIHSVDKIEDHHWLPNSTPQNMREKFYKLAQDGYFSNGGKTAWVNFDKIADFFLQVESSIFPRDIRKKIEGIVRETFWGDHKNADKIEQLIDRLLALISRLVEEEKAKAVEEYAMELFTLTHPKKERGT